jgi:hypothetical protein
VIRSSIAKVKDLNDSRDTVAALWELDIKFLNWAQSLPPDFLITQVPVPATSRGKEVWGDYYNIYSSIFVASLWNHYACVRILTNELLRHQITSILHWSSPLEPRDIQTEQGLASFETISP